MFQFFSSAPKNLNHAQKGFSYLSNGNHYFDSACQTLRPMEVQMAEQEYYQQFNACGGRVKYKWGERVDSLVGQARSELLKLAGKTEKDYVVVFTLNTTYGINLVLQQIDATEFASIITTDKEHNSVFLPTITWAKQHQRERYVLSRTEQGGINIDELPQGKKIFIANCVSNIDGQVFNNFSEVADRIHAEEGIVLVDAAQAFSSEVEVLRKVDFDAAFSSGHKMYGPSIGFMIVKKKLIKKLIPWFIGGGTVQDVNETSYTLVQDEEELYALLEPGLQNWAGIIGLLEAVKWKKSFHQEVPMRSLVDDVYSYLSLQERIHLVNTEASPTMSFYVDDLDSHQLALYLAEKNIMCRSGYFCCHYYLKHKKNYPPLLRVSLGLHTTPNDIEVFKDTLSFILSHF